MRMGQGVRTGLGHGASPVSYRHNFLVNHQTGRIVTQWAYGAKLTSYRRRCDDIDVNRTLFSRHLLAGTLMPNIFISFDD